MLALRIALGIISVVAAICARIVDVLSTTRKIQKWIHFVCFAIGCLTGVIFAAWSILEIFLDPVLSNSLILGSWMLLMCIFGKNA